MKTLEITGYKRANLGKTDAKKLRVEGKVPCVLYGGKEQIHFETPMINFRDLVYTTDAHFVNISVDGKQARRSIVISRSAPAADNKLAFSLAAIETRGLSLRSCLA